MTINLKMPEIQELKPKITVFGVGGAGGNAVNNMIRSGLLGCEFVVANTDSQALSSSRSERLIQMGVAVTEGDHGLSAAELERRLLELGFVEGAKVEVLHEGPLGRDPIAVRVNDTTIALRRREAMAILMI